MGITQYIYIAIAVIMLGMVGTITYLKKENDKLHEAQGSFKEAINELQGALLSKDKTIQLCSERTRKLVEEGDRRAKDAEKARNEAREAGKKNRELADQLLKFKPKDGETTCQAAERLFDEYLEKRGQ